MSTNEVVDKSTLEQPKVNLETAKPVKEEKPAASAETKNLLMTMIWMIWTICWMILLMMF